MSLLVIYGILLITIGAFMSGSFSIPFDKVKQWKWETSWLVYCLFGYLIVPLVVCLLTVPDFLPTLAQVPSRTLLWVFLLGALYGAANLTFGLSLRYLGLALGYALSLGLMMALGTLVPPALDGRLAQLFEGNAGMMLISGIIISLIGIGISGYAGYLKSKNASDKSGVNKEFNIKKGLAAALFVGVTGSSAALGIDQGSPIAKICIDNGVNPLFQDSIVFLVLYSGSFVTTLIWCLYLSVKNKTVGEFIRVRNGSVWFNYLFCALAGFLWFINYVFFGMGKSKMGEFSFVAWGILMTMTIVCATLWGLYRKEWKNVSTKIYALMWTGLIVLVLASFLIGISVN
jgi:L-rhamnose-H+ transport protein